jgi:hypothetical protein
MPGLSLRPGLKVRLVLGPTLFNGILCFVPMPGWPCLLSILGQEVLTVVFNQMIGPAA